MRTVIGGLTMLAVFGFVQPALAQEPHHGPGDDRIVRMMGMIEQMQAEMRQMHEQMQAQMQGHMKQMREQMMGINGTMQQHRAERQNTCDGAAAAAPAPK